MAILRKLAIISVLITLIKISTQYDPFVKSNRHHLHRRQEILDSEGKYWMEWSVDWADSTITFNITAETTGWVGFGLSNNGKMSGADIVIGGLYDSGLPYFSDRHAVKSDIPVKDPSQDWTLLDCVESEGQTFLSVKRKLDTCDPHDYPITENRVAVIWAYGESDRDITYHKDNRGSYDVYLLDPSWAPRIIRDERTNGPSVEDTTGLNLPNHLETWTISRRMRLPTNDTAYTCAIHRAPRLRKKHHVIGFDFYFADEMTRLHTHHLDIYKCNVPRAGEHSFKTARELFEEFVGAEPQSCYILFENNGRSMPTHLCTEYYMGWTYGGRKFFNPNHVGFPFGNDLGEDEYFLTQVHNDNPQRAANIDVDIRMDFFYTRELRKQDGGLLLITHEIPGRPESFLLPPNADYHRIYGHCSPECTRRILGPGGSITAHSALMHAHLTSKNIRLHHFRKGVELPWIVFDDNWSSSFQHFRNLRKEIEILPGDQLTVECGFDTRSANGTTVVGGYSTRQEMCLAYIVYHNRISDYQVCASEVASNDVRRRFLGGAERMTWVESRLNWVANEPRNLSGYTAGEISDNFVRWDDKMRKELQREQTVRAHQGSCYREPFSRNIPILPFAEGLSEDDFRGPVHYPLDVEAYQPPAGQCPKL